VHKKKLEEDLLMTRGPSLTWAQEPCSTSKPTDGECQDISVSD
jgi:hypothetical protein